MSAHALGSEVLRGAACANVGPVDIDGEEIERPEDELDVGELPALDTEDAEAPLQEVPDYTDLLDGGWLERLAESSEDEDEGASYVDVGLTIELNGPETGEELSQIVDLDVGSLLTSLPDESAEFDADARHSDGAFALGAFGELTLPNGEQERTEHGDDAVGDDERFPAFEDSLIATRHRAPPDDGDGVTDDDVA